MFDDDDEDNWEDELGDGEDRTSRLWDELHFAERLFRQGPTQANLQRMAKQQEIAEAHRECRSEGKYEMSEPVKENPKETEKRFPIQQVGSVPWWAAERAYLAYSRRYGNSQSLERLAERGGFGLQEFAWLYYADSERSANGPNPGSYDGDNREWSHVSRNVVRVVQELGSDFIVYR